MSDIETVSVPLSKPIKVPGTDAVIDIHEVVMREPRYADIKALGQVTLFARDQSGMVYTAEKDEVIHAYIERLLQPPMTPLLLAQVGPKDTLALRDAVHGFF